MTALAALLWFAVVTASADGRADRERSWKQPLPPCARAFVEHSQGDLHVLASPEDGAAFAELRVAVTGGSELEEQDFLAHFGLDVTPPVGGEPCKVRTVLPEPQRKPPHLSFRAELRLWLPRGCAIDLHSRYGAVHVVGRDEAVQVFAHLGPVRIADVRAKVDVENHYDRVVVERVEGEVTASTNSEGLEIREVTGNVHAVGRFGEIVVEDVRGEVRVENRTSSVTLRRIDGGATVEAPHCGVVAEDIENALVLRGNNGELECHRIGGEVRVEHRHSSVNASVVGGDLIVQGDFVPVRAVDVEGGVELQLTSSSVHMERVHGTTAVTTTSGPLVLVDPQGDVEAHGHGGTMRLEFSSWPAERAGHTLTLENRHGPLELVLPDDFDASVEATSTIGRIDCEFEDLRVETVGSTKIGRLQRGTGTTALHATALGNTVRLLRARSR